LGTKSKKKRELVFGSVIAGDFEVEDITGRGAFATVYRARQLSKNKRFIALKVLNESVVKQLGIASTFAANPFLKVQLVCDRLKDPIICRVIKVGTTKDKIHYMALEWARGESMDKFLRRHPKGVPPIAAAQIIQLLGRALGHMHRKKVVHCDFKPANIMLDSRDMMAVRPKILDFGLAKLENEDNPMPEHRLGTPAYMAPEQAHGARSDRRADVFNFCAVAYQILSGERAIQMPDVARPSGEQYIAYLKSNLPTPTRPFHEVMPHYPKAISDAIQIGMQRNRNKRIPDVERVSNHIVAAMAQAGLLQDNRSVYHKMVDWFQKRFKLKKDR